MIRIVRVSPVVFLLTALMCGCAGDGSGPAAPERVSAVDDFGLAIVPKLVVDTFAGDVTLIRNPAPGIHVVATKWARRGEDLDSIQLVRTETDAVARLEALNPSALENVSVDFSIALPAGRELDIHTGSGKIEYRGLFSGNAAFRADAGLIIVRIPPETQIRLELDVGVGSIFVDFDVEGDVSSRKVNATIGDGRGGSIRASVGIGNIQILRE